MWGIKHSVCFIPCRLTKKKTQETTLHNKHMWFITARQLMNITLGDKKIPRYQVKPPRCGAHSGDGISSYSQQHWLKAFRDNKQGLKHTFPFQVHSLTYKKRGLTSLNMINCETVDYRSILVYIFSDISQLQFAPQTNTGWYYLKKKVHSVRFRALFTEYSRNPI